MSQTNRPKHYCTFHIDGSTFADAQSFALKAAGRTIPLIAHDAHSRAAARAAAPHLAAVPDHELTHYTASPVAMPADAASRVHFVVRREPTASDPRSEATGLALIHVPNGHSQAGPHRRGVGSAPETAAQLHLNYVTTAQAFLFHHSDLMTTDPTIASVVFEHMSQDTARRAYDLIELVAGAMRQAATNHSADPNQPSWFTLYPVEVPTSDGNGGFNYDQTKTSYMVQVTEAIQEVAKPAMNAVLVSTKNDLRLAGTKWVNQQGQSVQDVSSWLAQQSPTGGASAAVPTATLASFPRPKAKGAAADATSSDQWTAAVTNTNKIDGLITTVEVTDSANMQVEITFENYYLRYLAAYIEFIDADGNVMSVPDWIPDGASHDWGKPLEYDTLRWLGYMDPVLTISAIPVSSDPGTLTVSVTFPAGAVSANVYGCGLGLGSFEHPKAYVLGALFTGVANLAVPAILLGFGVAAQTYEGLYKAMKSAAVIGTILLVGGTYYAISIGYDAIADHEVDWQAFSTIGTLAFSKGCTAILVWMEAQIVAGEVEDAIPFAGWIMLAINIATGLASISETLVEVATSPWQIPNSISTAILSTVTVHPDPQHQAWPQAQAGDTVTCTLNVTYNDGRATLSSSQTIPADYTQPTISFQFPDTLGGEFKLEVDYTINNWQAAKATLGWTDNNVENAADIILYLVQQPIPITATSTFQQAALLEYQNGAYLWQPTTVTPTATITATNTSPDGNAISEWYGLTLSQYSAMLGFAWRAAGTGVTDCTSGAAGQLGVFQNVNIPGAPMNAVKFPDCGMSGGTLLIYDPYPPQFLMENGSFEVVNGYPVPDPNAKNLGAYYLDSRPAQTPIDQGGGYHLRQVVLDTSTPFNMQPSQPSFGRFQYFPDSIVIHPSGHVIAINRQYAIVQVSQLPPQGMADDQIPVARTYAGQASNYDGSGGRAGLLLGPISLTCSYDGTILILDAISYDGFASARIQAFDIHGWPVDCFAGENGPSPFLPLPTGVTYLDVCAVGDQKQCYLFVLYYEGDGSQPSQYKVAVYQYGTQATAANPIVTTSGVNAAAIMVDMWNTLYTLNYAMTPNGNNQPAGPVTSSTGPAGRTVPSLGEWLLPVPA